MAGTSSWIAAIACFAAMHASFPAVLAQEIEPDNPAVHFGINDRRGHGPSTLSEIQASDREAVMNLLALVPHRNSGPIATPQVHYVNVEALVQQTYATTVPEATIAALEPDEILAIFERVSSEPRIYFDLLPSLVERMPESLGVGVTDVHRILAFGRRHPSGMMLSLDPNRDFRSAIAAALEARHFDWRDVDGVTVWYRGEDGDVSPRSRDLAYLHGALVGSDRWSVIERIIATGDEGRSLADEPVVQAIVAAVTDPALHGSLLQLRLLSSADARHGLDRVAPVVHLAPTISSVRVEQPPETLPPYLYVALADRSSGDQDEVLIALLYVSARNAELAASVLADRLADFEPAGSDRDWRGLLERLNATISSDVVRAGDGPLVAALVRVSYRVPPTTDGIAAGNGVPRGAVFRFLTDALSAN